MNLKRFDELPDGWFDAKPTDLRSILGGPSLIKLKGRLDQPVFVSIMLHGNETSGFYAVNNLLKKYRDHDRQLPRSLIIFVGNVDAAEKGVRFLPGQNDYNRIWNGRDLPERSMAQAVLAEVEKAMPIVGIDIHNTSGRHPHYACINRKDPRFLNLAALFGRTVVYFENPKEVLSHALAAHAPSVTLEGGLPNDPYRNKLIQEFVDACLHMHEPPSTSIEKTDCQVFHSFARIDTPDASRVGIGSECKDVDFCFPEKLDQFNFGEMEVGMQIAYLPSGDKRLIVRDAKGNDLADEYFEHRDGKVFVRKKVVPSLLSANSDIIELDCVGYLMEEMSLDQFKG